MLDGVGACLCSAQLSFVLNDVLCWSSSICVCESSTTWSIMNERAYMYCPECWFVWIDGQNSIFLFFFGAIYTFFDLTNCSGCGYARWLMIVFDESCLAAEMHAYWFVDQSTLAAEMHAALMLSHWFRYRLNLDSIIEEIRIFILFS